MNDRELLELAAKAAGLRLVPYEQVPMLEADGQPYWNPLTDDGDALRLAVKLHMLCDFGAHGVLVEVGSSPSVCTEVGDYRRAIVRAAAEIGRARK